VEGIAFGYVGDAHVGGTAGGWPVGTPEEFAAWAATAAARDPDGVHTYVVGLDGVLRLAPRRSEHVACAGGGAVLAAGEIGFGDGGAVVEVTNQSTGYCPDAACWPAVAAALDAIGVGRPGGFTTAFVFRRCDGCGERNVVRDGDFRCAVCGAELPAEWNFGGQHGTASAGC
jgi:hypothetical protein